MAISDKQASSDYESNIEIYSDGHFVDDDSFDSVVSAVVHQ